MFVLTIGNDRHQSFTEYVVVGDDENGKKNQVKLAKWFKMAFNYTIEPPTNALTKKEAGELVALQLKRFEKLPFLAAILVKEELVTKDDPEKGLILYVAGKRSLYSVAPVNGSIDVSPDRLLWKLKAEDQQKYDRYIAAKKAEYATKQAAKEKSKETSNDTEYASPPIADGPDDDLPF